MFGPELVCWLLSSVTDDSLSEEEVPFLSEEVVSFLSDELELSFLSEEVVSPLEGDALVSSFLSEEPFPFLSVLFAVEPEPESAFEFAA